MKKKYNLLISLSSCSLIITTSNRRETQQGRAWEITLIEICRERQMLNIKKKINGFEVKFSVL